MKQNMEPSASKEGWFLLLLRQNWKRNGSGLRAIEHVKDMHLDNDVLWWTVEHTKEGIMLQNAVCVSSKQE